MRSPDSGLRSNCWRVSVSDQLHHLSGGQRLETRFAAEFFKFRVSWTAGVPRGRAGFERQRALQAR